MEAELQRLTASTEELTNRVNRIVEDGTNRIGDLEFRLVELEGGDISQLGETTTLGGDVGTPAAAVQQPEAGAGVELAVGEQADFDAARAAFDAGSYESAAIQFATFAETYTGGPLTAEAHYWRGMSLSSLGNTSGAARAFLESFSGDPDGRMAPLSLLALGLALDALGQSDEACLMLAEVTGRFPESASSLEAQTARVDMGCV
jgi:tol-pal system protein YbgF